ncbi:MAG TPA: hypothetical protein VHM72_05465 [Solirubrobacteraceae bacterium]|jgi:hypothetical protein|nr:hypothetical protein [Solirubrobacteraceae bacterium]
MSATVPARPVSCVTAMSSIDRWADHQSATLKTTTGCRKLRHPALTAFKVTVEKDGIEVKVELGVQRYHGRLVVVLI